MALNNSPGLPHLARAHAVGLRVIDELPFCRVPGHLAAQLPGDIRRMAGDVGVRGAPRAGARRGAGLDALDEISPVVVQGQIKGIGHGRRKLSLQVVGEIGIQTLLGFALGMAISLLTVAAVGSVSIQTKVSQGLANELTTLSAPLQLSGSAALQFFVLTLAVAVGLSLFMVRKLSGMKPLDNLKDR